MPNQVCMGATMQCSFGMAPSSLVVLPTNKVFTGEVPDANIMDHIPMVNIMPFGMCMSLANPEVAAGYRGGDGGSYAHAVHPQHTGAVGAGSTYGSSRQCADPR